MRAVMLFVVAVLAACGGRAAQSSNNDGTGNGGSSASVDAASGGAGSRGLLGDGGAPTSSSGAAAAGSGAEAANGGATDAGAPSQNGGAVSVGELAVCRSFLPIWQARQAEREPGSPSPPADATAPCFRCLEVNEAPCKLPVSDACVATSACIERHCLCEKPAFPSCAPADYPSELCACEQACLPPSGDCFAQWQNFMSCETAACAAACGMQ
jgi:hypothetical protein